MIRMSAQKDRGSSPQVLGDSVILKGHPTGHAVFFGLEVWVDLVGLASVSVGFALRSLLPPLGVISAVVSPDPLLPRDGVIILTSLV